MHLRHELRRIFSAALSAAAAAGDIPDDSDDLSLTEMVRATTDAKFGDYTATVAMPLAKRAGKPPRQVAEAIIAKLEPGEWFDAPQAPVGPGFINLTVKNEALGRIVAEAAADPRLGVPPVETPSRIVIDYSSPNVAKPMHVGHIRSTVIGDALARILAFRGHEVTTDNHLGDWGTQFGMILWGWKHCRNDTAYADNPTAELGRLYRLVRKAADAKPEELANDPEAAELAAAHPTLARDVLQETARLHEGDEENRTLWASFMPVCQAEIDRVYTRLHVHFDHTLGESFYQPFLGEVVEELLAKEIARESRGAIGIFTDGEEKPPLLIRKADGAFLYATTDLATIRWRMQHWKPDRVLYVVDHRQSQHFRQVFAAAEAWGYGDVDLVHVAFGTVLGEDGRPFKTRAGDTVGLEALLDEGVARALEVVATSQAARAGDAMPVEEQQAIAEAVGIGAIKYADLSQNRATDYVFSFDKMLELKGNTAAYMQYAVARVEGIFTKGGIERQPLREQLKQGEISFSDPRERALALQLARFPEALDEVEADYRPSSLTAYLYEVAGAYSTFYDALPVLKAEGHERTARLALCDLTGQVLRHGLELLGITVPTRM
jgi:arginyl-tRNA synthetase